MNVRLAGPILGPILPLLLLLLTPSCGGDTTAGSAPSPGGSGAGDAPASAGPSTSTAKADTSMLGLWIDDKNHYVHLYGDGRYSAFGNSDLRQDLRVHDCSESEDGGLALPAVHRKATWRVVSGQLTGQVTSRDGEPRTVRTFRRLQDAEQHEYWAESGFRLVRAGALAEIREAEAAGFDFRSVSDLDGQPGDLLETAVEHGRREVFDHLLTAGFDLTASNAAQKAMERGDVELLTHVLDRGFPVQQLLRDGLGRADYSDAVWTLIIERGYEFGDDDVPALGGGHPVSGTMLVEKGIYSNVFALGAVAAAGRLDLIDKVVTDHPELTERPERLYQIGVIAAVEAGQVDAIEKLRALGAPLDTKFGRSTIQTLAVRSNDPVPVLKYLLAKGMPLTERNQQNRTPLDEAIFADAPVEVFEVLFDAGAKPDPRRHPSAIRRMKNNKDAVLELFEQRTKE